MMCQANTQDRVRAVMARLTGKAPADFAATATLDELGLDSLDRVEIAMALEDEFAVEIDIDRAEARWVTVQDIFATVKELHG